MKKSSLLVLLILITVLGTGTASFAVCTATSLSAAGSGNGIWGLEAFGQAPGPKFDNILIQATFVSAGTFTGTEWQSLAGSLSSFAISGTWSMTAPAADCQGVITVTSPSTQTFTFALNSGVKGGTLAQIDVGYTMAGFMVPQGVITGGCTPTLFKNKAFSLYSDGTIPAVGGLVTGMGELKFDTTGSKFSSAPTVTLDLGAAGNFVVPASGTATITAACTGTGTLTVPALGASFDVDTVVVNAGKEVLWVVSDAGDNVSGYFLQ